MLKSARIKKSWTPEFVSGKVGVSLTTYIRWELGIQTPRNSSLDALCKIFEMSPEELGFSHIPRKIRPTYEKAISKQETSHALNLRRHEEIAPSETLTLWSMGIASCWQLYMVGGQVELERLLPTYQVNLTKPTLYPGPDQKTAARLTAQVYQISALLELQRGNFAVAQTHGTQALVYSQLAKDWNLYIASQIRLAAIFSARKRVGSALSAFNDALQRVNTRSDTISPILHSWIFTGLSEIQATMGRGKEALHLLQLASAIFPEKPEDDSCNSYAQCDRSMLFLYEGLVFLRLGQPKLAWDAFAQIDNLKPAPPERTRAEFLKQKAYTSFMLGNMVQTCVYLEAAVKAARDISSDLAFSETYSIYEHMLALWGQEARVRTLAKLFQK